MALAHRPRTLEERIIAVRGLRVMLDSDLAELYSVSTKALVQAVKRNMPRFPADFMFQLRLDECIALRSHSVTSNGRGGRRYRPYVFTEQGIAMLSGVLRSDRAVRVNIEIMRAFVRLRTMLGGHADLARRLDDLEQKYDTQFRVVFDAIRALMKVPDPPKRRIGFQTKGNGG